MPLTAVVVTYNSEGCVTACVRALETHLPEAERIVVDNGSVDRTLELVRQTSPGTAIVSGGGNIGFGQACNLGVRSASNRHVLLLNPDVVVRRADREALQKLFKLPVLGLVAPLLAADSDATARHHVLPQRHWVSEALEHALGPLRPRELAGRRMGSDATGQGWVSGAMLVVRCDEFERVGGFSDDLFLYYEDRDLSARYLNAGLPLRRSSALVGLHA